MCDYKVAIIIDNAYSYGGTENICSYMVKSLSPLFNVDVISLKGQGETFYPFTNVNKLISFSDKKKPLLHAVKFIKANKYTHVFVISMGRLSVFFSILMCMYHINKVSKVYACEHVAFNSFSRLIKFLKIKTLKYYDNIIVLTESDRVNLKANGLNSIVISNPIDYKFFSKNKLNKNILAVGRLTYQKGFDLMIEIWKKFIILHPEWKLNILGDGDLKEALQQKINSYGLEGSVTLHGRVKNVDEFYKENDLFLMTSRYEGLPLVLLEAKSWSLPCIAYDCPTGPKEIISDNKDGFLIPFSNSEEFLIKLELLADNPDLIFKMSDATKFTHIQFSSEQISKKWIKLIR